MDIVLSHKIREQWNDYVETNKEYEFDELLVILKEAKELVPAPDYVLQGCRAFEHDDVPGKLFLAKNLDPNGTAKSQVLFTAIIQKRVPGQTHAKKITLDDLHAQNIAMMDMLNIVRSAIVPNKAWK